MEHLTASQILGMSVPERLRLIQALWDSIAEAPDTLPVTDGDRQELDRRLEAYYNNPEAGSPWPEVLQRIKNRG